MLLFIFAFVQRKLRCKDNIFPQNKRIICAYLAIWRFSFGHLALFRSVIWLIVIWQFGFIPFGNVDLFCRNSQWFKAATQKEPSFVSFQSTPRIVTCYILYWKVWSNSQNCESRLSFADIREKRHQPVCNSRKAQKS